MVSGGEHADRKLAANEIRALDRAHDPIGKALGVANRVSVHSKDEWIGGLRLGGVACNRNRDKALAGLPGAQL